MRTPVGVRFSHLPQNRRVTPGELSWTPGVPPTKSNALARTPTKVETGAPDERRQSRQWQWLTQSGPPLAR